MLLGQELKFKNKLCNLKLGTFFSALPGLGASALSGRVGQNLRNPEILIWFSQLLQMVQSATPDGSVSESRRLDKSTDTTPLAYVVESLTRCSRILNLVQPSA